MKLRMPEACFPGIGIKYSSVIPSKQLIRRKNFQFFGAIDGPETSGGTGKNYILKNDFNYFLNPNGISISLVNSRSIKEKEMELQESGILEEMQDLLQG
jgi:hypothetical protein